MDPEHRDGIKLDEHLIQSGKHTVVTLVTDNPSREHDVLVSQTFGYDVLDTREITVFSKAVKATSNQNPPSLEAGADVSD